MKTLAEWKAAAGTWLRVFLSSALAALLTLIMTTGNLPTDLHSLQAIVISGLVSVLPVVINALNSRDSRYGMGFKPQQ
jgi:hypothetical protein